MAKVKLEDLRGEAKRVFGNGCAIAEIPYSDRHVVKITLSEKEAIRFESSSRNKARRLAMIVLSNHFANHNPCASLRPLRVGANDE